MSGVVFVEVFHEVDEVGDGVEGVGVVDGGADAADGAMSFDADEAGGESVFDEGGFEVFGGQSEDDVHLGAVLGSDVVFVEALGVIDGSVDEVGFGGIFFFDGLDAASVFEPMEDLVDHVDGEGGRGVEEGVFVGVSFVGEHGGQAGAAFIEDVVTDDDDGDAGGSEVFLGAGVDDAEGCGVEGAREDVAGHIGDEGYVAGVGEGAELGAEDGVVGGEVAVGGVGVEVELVLGGDGAEDAVLFGGGGDSGVGDDFGFFDGFFAPGAGDYVVGGLVGGEEVHGGQCELEAGTALEEEYGVAVGEAHEFFDEGDGVVVDLVVFFASVAGFHDADAAVLEVEELIAGSFEGGEGQSGGTGVVIVDTWHF